MDNSRAFRKTSSRTPRGVDGFVSNSPRLGPSQSARLRAQAPSRKKLDAFTGARGTTGFTSTTHKALGDAPKHPRSAAMSTEAIAREMSVPLLTETPRRRGEKKRHKRHWFKRVLKIFGVLLILAVLVGGFLFAKGYLKLKGVFKGGGNAPALSEVVDPSKLNGEGDGRVNILLLGRGGEGHDGADLTDTVIVASIDPIQKQAALLSVPRDLWVKNPKNKNAPSKINQVFADTKNAALVGTKRTSQDKQKAEEAGVEAIETVIEQVMGIPVHYYVLVDFAAFEQAINTVGGVDLYVAPTDTSSIVKETMWDPTVGKHYVLDVKPGNNHFDGKRALMYTRSRHTSARGDFDRSERQRKMLIALKEKILSAGTYSNPAKLNGLLDAFGDHIRSNLSTGELLRINELAKGIAATSISSLDLVTAPHNFLVDDRSPSNLYINRPRAGMYDYSEIQNYVRNALRDSFLQKESAKVAVYNGTKTSGLATTKANELKSFGYEVTTVANASNQTYTKTTVVDLTNGSKKYTKHYLEQRFGVTAVTALPDATISADGADFVIILGSDASSTQ